MLCVREYTPLDPDIVAISPVVLVADYVRVVLQSVIFNEHVGTALQSVPLLNNSVNTSDVKVELPPVFGRTDVVFSVFFIIAVGPSHAA